MTPEEVEQATVDTVAANNMRDAYIRLVITRGKGDLGIDPDKCPKPTFFIIVSTIALYPAEMYEQGIPLVTASTRRIPMECLDPRIKSLNYLNNILAKIEAKKAGVLEAVMLNHDGRVAECTADNIFIVKNGKLITPRLTEGALPGITRASVLELAREAGLQVRETVLGLHDLYNADECFLTGTGAEIMPVTAIDGRQIGDGKPGETTKRLLAQFRELRVKDGSRWTTRSSPRSADQEGDCPYAGRAAAASTPLRKIATSLAVARAAFRASGRLLPARMVERVEVGVGVGHQPEQPP